MARESNAIRDKTRRVKDLILDKYLKMAEMEETTGFANQAQADMFKDLTLVFAKSVVPRTQEITGEDGEKLVIPIYGGISRHNSDQKDIQPEETN